MLCATTRQTQVQACERCGLCPLLFKVIRGAGMANEAMIDEAIAAGARLDQFLDGRAPLHHLSLMGNVVGVRLLLSKGADVAQRSARHQPPELINHACGGGTPLHFAVREGHRNTVALLIESGAPLEQYDDHGLLPLHIAALTEIFMSFADFDGSCAEQLLHAGANPWAVTFNEDMKRPAALADGGFDDSVSCYHTADVPSQASIALADSRLEKEPERRAGYRWQWKPTAAESARENEVFAAHKSTKLATDCLQRNNKMHLFLKAAVTPGTHVFIKAQQAELARLGHNHMYTESNATRQNRGQYEGVSPLPANWTVSEFMELQKLKQVYPTPTRLDGVQNAGDPSPIERAAVSARGLEADNYRLRSVVEKMENQIWKLRNDLSEAEADLRGAMDQVDELMKENSELRAACDDRYAEGGTSNAASDDGSIEESAGTGKAAKGRNRKTEQARKARVLVDSGAVLTRLKIADLNKAEARAYLKVMPKVAVRGNIDELKDRLRKVFDANGLDTFQKGDDVTAVPSD